MISRRILGTILAAAIFVPGCYGDTGTIGGLVAAGLVAFLFLIVVVALLLLGICWRKLYHEMQTRKGKKRVARVKKQKLTESQKSLTEVPTGYKTGSKIGDLHHFQPSRHTTLSNGHADRWIQELPPLTTQMAKPEQQEIIQTINFEDEEEPVIVTDVIDSTFPVNMQTTPAFEIDSTQTTSVPVTYPSSPLDITETQSRLRTTLQDWRMSQSPDTTEHGYAPPPASIASNIDMRASEMTKSRRTQDQVTSLSSTRNDIIIKPLVPSGSPHTTRNMDDSEAMMVFDDEDEEGQIIPNVWGQQGDVLF